MENEEYEKLQLQTKAFVTDLLAGLDVEECIQNNIGYIIEKVGNFTHAERVCIYEPDTENERVERVYQWKAGSMIADDTQMQSIKWDEISEWCTTLYQFGIIVVKDKEGIRDTMPVGYSVMERFGVHTLMLIPIYVKNRLIAGMVLVNPDFMSFALLESTWLFLGRQIGMIYHREKVNHKYLLFMEGIRSSNLSEFIVDFTTGRYEAFRITRLLNNLIPEEGDWDWLRQFYSTIIKPEYKEELLRCTERDYMETFLRTEKSTFYIDIEREADGSDLWFRLEFSVVSLDEKGHLERFVLLVKDITEQKQREEWMQYKIEHDELTGTLNRTAFNRVTKLLKESTTPFALMLIDIDKFKSINDTFGHDLGDKVLMHLVSVLNEKMRTSDKIFRLGGDEFAVIMNTVTLAQADGVKRIVESVNETIMAGKDNLPAFSVSAGVAFSVKGYDEMLYHNADKALYRTKNTTRRGCTVFEEMDA